VRRGESSEEGVLALDERAWNELQTRWAGGETLSTEAERERRDYAPTHPIARQELAWFDQLREVLREPSGVDPEPTLLARVLAQARARRQPLLRLVPDVGSDDAVPSVPARSHRRRVLVAATAAVALVGAWVAIGTFRDGGTNPARPSVPAPAASVRSPSPARCELVFASGEVKTGKLRANVGQSTLPIGQHVSTGRGHACLTIDPAIDLCLDQQTEVGLESLVERDLVVRVLRGTVAARLDPRAPGRRFRMVAGELTAIARGTVFAVSHLEHQPMTQVMVVEGAVEVTRTENPPTWLGAHSRLTVGAQVQRDTVGRSQEAKLWSLLAPRELWQVTALGVLELGEREEGDQAFIGSQGPFELALRTFVPAGRHRLRVRHAAGTERLLEIEVAAGSRQRIEATAAGAGAAAAPAAPKRVEPLTPAASLAPSSAPLASARSLLDEARRELGRGNSQAALQLYRQLRTSFPASPEASTVLVTMGKLELNLNSPAAALADFDAYLKQGGPLGPEALAGKIRALRALGRTQDERRAIEQYLTSFPRGFEASGLEQRLEVLRSR
jgi:hypothetical protein